ncbi:hypothetical protein C1H46_023125 [Malus baccata]|uniref:Uncharacterized protein n=1 Tax=Malus baccata TaxID=106549 RepID=A0A540LXQ4_MALBA|nr:hypothetical protein C1H46_023125 [Malus baccata]
MVSSISLILFNNLLEYRESLHQCLIPGFPDYLTLRCKAKVSHGNHSCSKLSQRSGEICYVASDYANYEALEKWCGNWLFVIDEV